MSNYLNHLIARSFNQADVVKPRPISLFEPVSPMLGGAIATPIVPIATDKTVEPSDFATPEINDLSESINLSVPQSESLRSTALHAIHADITSADITSASTVSDTVSDTVSGAVLMSPTVIPISLPMDESFVSSLPLTAPTGFSLSAIAAPFTSTPSIAAVPATSAMSLTSHASSRTIEPNLELTQPWTEFYQSGAIATPTPLIQFAAVPENTGCFSSPSSPSSPSSSSLPSGGGFSSTTPKRSPSALKLVSPPLSLTEIMLSPELSPNSSPRFPSTTSPAIADTLPHLIFSTSITRSESEPDPISSSRSPAVSSHPPLSALPSAPSSPTIHVTIGRVEVRAIPPAPSATPTRSKPPVMSLEDYLRQRSGGVR